MTDGLLYRSLPAFTGLLVFMPACPGDEPTATDTDATDGSSSSSGDSATSPSTTNSTTSPEDTSSSESSPTDPSDTDTPATCPEDSLCADNLPENWFGPLIMARSGPDDTPPECPEEFPIEGPDLRDGFVSAGDAECSCECTPPAMMNCYASVVTSTDPECNSYYYYYKGGYGYGGGGNQYYQVDELCHNIDMDDFARFNLFGFYAPGPCTAETTESVPPISWEASIKTCQLSDDPLSCQGDGVCIPPPVAGFESVWCLYQQGDVGCPAGVFNTKHKFYTGAEDTRACSDCVCGSTAANCYTGDLLMFEGPDCAGEPAAALPANNDCSPVQAASVAVQYPGGDTCPVSNAPHAMGDAHPVGDFTFCCTG